MATDIIARGMAANAKKSVTELGNKVESEKWIGTKAEWEAVDKSTIKDGTIVYITDDKTVILYDKRLPSSTRTAREATPTTAAAIIATQTTMPIIFTLFFMVFLRKECTRPQSAISIVSFLIDVVN